MVENLNLSILQELSHHFQPISLFTVSFAPSFSFFLSILFSHQFNGTRREPSEIRGLNTDYGEKIVKTKLYKHKISTWNDDDEYEGQRSLIES